MKKNISLMQTEKKVEHSIELIQKAEKLALYYQDYGFHLAFSGGKDSQVVYELAKMAGVKFRAFMSITTIDHPEVMRFVRKNYPDVTFIHPKFNFYDLIIKMKCLPTRKMRYCCKYLKEQAGINSVVMTGIRREESIKRSERNEFEISPHKYSNTFDQFNIDFESKIVCMGKKDKIIFNPIIDWTYNDVWNFISEKKLEYCSLYDEGFNRIGCIFCPMTSKKIKSLQRKRYPRIEKKIKDAIRELVKINHYGSKLGCDVDMIFDWWVSNERVDKYISKLMQYKIEYPEKK